MPRILLLRLGLVFLLASSVACGPASDPASSAPAIVGGSVPTASSPAPLSTVSLVQEEQGVYTTVCSGILIAPNLVLTAAHCVESRKPALLALFGSADTDPTAKTVAIDKVLTYKPSGSRFFPNFDIAWVRLRKNAPLPWKPVEMLRSPSTLNAFEGKADKILLAGYGRTASVCKNSECMGRLYEVWTNLKHFFNEAHFINLLVIGPNAGHGTCNGDSGGPAFVQIRNRWFLAGILNGKSPLLNSPNLWEKGVCESGEAIYNFAGAYIAWIESTSGVTLTFDAAINPSQEASELPPLDDISTIAPTSSLEEMLGFNNHNEHIWATVETLFGRFKDPANRYGATVEELVTDSRLAAAAMRRWTEFQHLGLSFDFVISSQKSNQLTDIRPIGKLISLRRLNLDSNKIENTTALGLLDNLEDLTLRNNYDYSLKRKVSWDFSFLQRLRRLKRLDLSNNQGNLNLKSIAWENLRFLEHLELSDNGRGLDLDEVPWGKLTNLKRLTIRNSQLRNIDALRHAKSLVNLDLSRNDIRSIASLAELRNLAYLDVSMNQIADFSPLRPLTNLSSLKALSNLQTENYCPAGASCVYSPVSFSDFASYCQFAFTLAPDDLNHWSGGATVMRLIQISGVEAFQENACRDAQTKLSRMRSIDLSGSPTTLRIEDLSPLSPLKHLEVLTLKNNDLRNLKPLAQLEHLKVLDISQNYVDDLSPLAKLTSLERIYLGGNLVTDLRPLGELAGLVIFANDNPVQEGDCPAFVRQCYFDDTDIGVYPRTSAW